MEDAEQQPQAAVGGNLPPHLSGLVKLPAFWTEDPVSWFRLAERQFTLQNVVDPIARYYHVLSSLSQDAVRPVRHVLHEETGLDSYDNLRTSLMASHLLSNYQKMERMMKLPGGGVHHCRVHLPLSSASAARNTRIVLRGRPGRCAGHC
jgi:hypothetical protein